MTPHPRGSTGPRRPPGKCRRRARQWPEEACPRWVIALRKEPLEELARGGADGTGIRLTVVAKSEEGVRDRRQQQSEGGVCASVIVRRDTSGPTAKGFDGSHRTAVWTGHSAEAARPGLLCQRLGSGLRPVGALRKRQDLCVHGLETGPLENVTRFGETSWGRQQPRRKGLVEVTYGSVDEVRPSVKVLVAGPLRDAARSRDLLHA